MSITKCSGFYNFGNLSIHSLAPSCDTSVQVAILISVLSAWKFCFIFLQLLGDCTGDGKNETQ